MTLIDRLKKDFSAGILKNPDFIRLLLTRMSITFALQSQAVIVGWQVYDITKDPLMLGLIGLTEAVPAIISALYAGHVVDTRNPKTIYRVCVAALIINIAFLAIIGGGYVDAPLGTLLPWLFGGVFFSGLARGFIMPSSFALALLVVPRAQLPAATAWMTSGFQTAAIGGPAIAGILYAIGGAHTAWLFPCVLIIFCFVMLMRLQVTPPPHTFKEHPAPWKNIREGWAFILKNPIMISVMTLDMFAVLFGGATAMLPAFANEVLHIGPEGLGALRAMPAIGAIATSIVFALMPMKTITGKRLLICVAAFGVCMVGFGLSTSFWVAAFFLMLSGGFDAVSMIIRSTVMQIYAPDTMRGRIASVNSMFIISSNEIGAFQSGVAARLLGLTPSIIAGGLAAILVVAVTSLLSPSLRTMVLEAHKDPKKD